MSERIVSVLATLPQSFTTAEQKIGRDNIGAQASLSYSYSGSTITAIDGSAVGQTAASFSGVWTTPAFTGSGTNSSDKLGLNSSFTLSSTATTAQLMTFAYNGYTAFNHGSKYTSYSSPTGSEIKVDLGGSTAHCWNNINGFAVSTPLPGNDWVSSYFLKDGIKMCGMFASNVYQDDINSSMRYQGTGNTGNGLIEDIGFYNGDSVLRYPYITMYTPNESATIYMSSISSWNNKLGSVNIGTGLSGDGVSTPIAVTGFSSIFQGYHSDYYGSLTGHELAFSAYNKDSSIPENKCVLNEYGIRVSAYQDDMVIRLQTDGVSVGNSATDTTAMLDDKKLRMTDATAYADLTRSSIEAINAVYNWATSQGMQPI